jgi:tRNA (guanine26-N2/guanine27-N2)-dimethyltransferase
MLCVLNHHSRQYRAHEFVILEALSATGLRSIRYAKEIPLVRLACRSYPDSRPWTLRQLCGRYVIANDLSPPATAAMTRNVELNGLGGDTATDGSGPGPEGAERLGKVQVNQGDAR